MRVPDRGGLVLALVLLVGAPAAADARGLVTGFYDGAFADASGVERLDEAERLGAGSVRIPVNWATVASGRPDRPADPEDRAYRWTALDVAVAEARTRGFEVLLTLNEVPAWAEAKNRPKRYRQGSFMPSARDAGRFATAVARRYAGSVKYLQLFNEPNLELYLAPQWRGRAPFAPARYRAILNAAYPGVHAAGLEVVTAGTAPYGDPGRGRRIRPLLFWKYVLRKPARFDIFAHHPYSVRGPNGRSFNRNDIALPDMHRLVRLVRRSPNALPRGGKRIWVTELSWDSRRPDPNGVPMKRLTRWVSDAFYVLWRQGIDRVFWFQVRDQAPDPSFAGSYQSGMFFRNGRAKPVSRAFAFPFRCTAKGSNTRVWLLAPGNGPVSVVSASGATLKRVPVGADRIAVTTVRGSGRLRAVQGERRSPTCKE